MAEPQTLIQTEFDERNLINFTLHELTLFKEELDRQFVAGKGVDIIQALYCVRYMAMLDKCAKEKEETKFVTFTDEEWKAFIKAQKFFMDSRD